MKYCIYLLVSSVSVSLMGMQSMPKPARKKYDLVNIGGTLYMRRDDGTLHAVPLLPPFNSMPYGTGRTR